MIKMIKRFFIVQQASIRLWVASKKADMAYNKAMSDNARDKRFYVMPDANNKLIIMNRSQFRKLKKYNYMSNDVLIKHLLQECFYFTPYHNGKEPITKDVKKIKRVMYLQYCLYGPSAYN